MMRRSSLADRAYEELRAALVEGRIERGDSIAETELAAMLGVSRTPVRAAVLRLELEGHVERHAGGRLIVRPYSADEVMQMFGIRELLEVHAAGLAATRISDQELDQLEGLLALDRDALAHFRVEQLAAVNDEIHAVVLRASRNRTLVDLVIGLRQRAHGLGAFIVGQREDQGRFVLEHQELVRLLRAGEREAVQELVRDHIRRARDLLLREFGREEGGADTDEGVSDGSGGTRTVTAAGSG